MCSHQGRGAPTRWLASARAVMGEEVVRRSVVGVMEGEGMTGDETGERGMDTRLENKRDGGDGMGRMGCCEQE